VEALDDREEDRVLARKDALVLLPGMHGSRPGAPGDVGKKDNKVLGF
jgi:hypothetical protein